MGRVAVAGILLRGDRVLLVKRAASRAFYPGVWDLPGGHSEEGEAPEQTLVRELAEELGVVPIKQEKLPFHSVTEGPLHCYNVTQWTGSPSNLQNHEHSEIAWVPLTEVAELELATPVILSMLEGIEK